MITHVRFYINDRELTLSRHSDGSVKVSLWHNHSPCYIGASNGEDAMDVAHEVVQECDATEEELCLIAHTLEEMCDA